MRIKYANKTEELADEMHYVINHKYCQGLTPYYKYGFMWLVRKEETEVAAIQNRQFIDVIMALRALIIATRKKGGRDADAEKELQTALISYLIKHKWI
jgi:hypothetical protein